MTRSDKACAGFWLPKGLRDEVLAGAGWQTYWLKDGHLRGTPDAGGVPVTWPRLAPLQWEKLLAGPQRARCVPGPDFAGRWQAALSGLGLRLAERAGDLLPPLEAATGYSVAMLGLALAQGDLVNPASLASSLQYRPSWRAATTWQPMPDLPGWVRFFPERPWDHLPARLRPGASLFQPAMPTDLVLGFAAGNVPGTALMIALIGGLAQAGTFHMLPAPALLTRNSRHEPLFTPWVLEAVEAVDPDLVSGLAVLVWDAEDEALQALLMRRAGLMLAAASDATIAALDALRARYAPRLRFHRHGHKVSFSVVQEYPRTGAARLAALDSSLWDQNGCLSARVHFVSGDAGRYAADLAAEMRTLAGQLPRGATPRRFLHRAFDSYNTLAHATGNGAISVQSEYQDDFVVVLDRRPWQRETLQRTVNACQGRVVVVRPVEDVLDVPSLLRWLPPANLQSISFAIAPQHLLEFATRVGACGVTSLRPLGRAAFPQLAYSWDGLLPQDVACTRAPGHFTTIEFDMAREPSAPTGRPTVK